MENTYDPLKSYLASSGQQFSQANLKSLANSKGIANYTGTDAQNKQLTGLLQTPTTPSTPLVTNMPTSTNVNANNLAQTTPVQLPSTPVSTVPTVPVSAADRILNQMGIDEQTNTQKVQENLVGKKLEAIMGLTGESAALAAEQEKAGVAKLKADLQNINSQILTKQAEIQQDDIQLISKLRNEERRDTLLPFAQMGQAKIQGDAAIYRALKTSEIGVLNATAIAKQGDIQLAKETAQEAVDVKYAPYREQIKQYDAVLEAISPLLTRDEKIQATKQQIRGQVAMKEIDRQAADEKQLNDMLIQASSQNAPQSLVAKARLAKTPSEAAMILGQYAGDYWATQKIKSEIAKINAEAAKTRAESNKISSELVKNVTGEGRGLANEGLALVNDILNNPEYLNASGRSNIRKFVEAGVVGATDYTNLESKALSIKNKLLPLKTDADVRKFFGPQMSNSDVKNILSVSTSLDVENQSPKELKTELENLQKTFERLGGLDTRSNVNQTADDILKANSNLQKESSGLNLFEK